MRYKFGHSVVLLRKTMKSQSEQMVVVAGYEFREFPVTKWRCYPLDSSHVVALVDRVARTWLCPPASHSYILAIGNSRLKNER
jgi:hypothetical protein